MFKYKRVNVYARAASHVCVYKTNTNSLIETYIKLQFSPARPSPPAPSLSYKSNLYAPDRKVESHSC